MLTDEQLELLGDKAAPLFQQLEQDVIADIARRIKKTGRYTETAELMAMALRKSGVAPDKIRAEVMKLLRADAAYQKELAENTKEYKEFVKSEIAEVERRAKVLGNEIVAEAGDMAFNFDLSLWESAGEQLTRDSAITKFVEEMGEHTAGTLKNLTNSTGFRNVRGFTSVQNAYIHAMDKAVMKMAVGAFAYDTCVNDVVKELAQSGLRSIDYASGRSYQLDTAARMCIRTSCHQLAGRISMQNCDTMDTDLVEVSAHWGARPEHAVWQGKVYSRSGRSKKYPNFSVCRYGEVDGLCGANCRHTFYPFFDGISEPTEWPKEPEPKEFSGKKYSYYDVTQQQRKMERNIRATKREIEAQASIGGDTKALEALKRKQIKEYHKFSEAMDIKAKDNRLRVVSGSSNLHYGTAKVLTKTEKRGILKLSKSGNMYLNKTDKLYANAEKIKPLKNYTDIVAHGDPYSIVFKDGNGNENNVSADEFVEIIKKGKTYTGGKIRLIACQTGAGDGIVPQYMADNLGVEVLAPTEIVNVDFNGNMILANDDANVKMGIETGKWITFYPRERK